MIIHCQPASKCTLTGKSITVPTVGTYGTVGTVPWYLGVLLI